MFVAALRPVSQRCEYDRHSVKPTIASGRRHDLHKPSNVPIHFRNLILCEPAGHTQTPQLSIRARNGRGGGLKALAEIADTQSQHRSNNRVYFPAIPLSPESIAEAPPRGNC